MSRDVLERNGRLKRGLVERKWVRRGYVTGNEKDVKGPHEDGVAKIWPIGKTDFMKDGCPEERKSLNKFTVEESLS